MYRRHKTLMKKLILIHDYGYDDLTERNVLQTLKKKVSEILCYLCKYSVI